MKVRELRLLSERYFPSYLAEGGAVGHLMHLYDNRELTFGELKDIIANAAEGRLEKVSEKLDGMNLVFTWDGELRTARNGGEIKSGGMDAAGLAKKFQGRGNVEEAFNIAFRVLEDAIGSLPGNVLEAAFEGGRVWYSIEVIYSKNPNVVNYDQNCVVLHNSPVFRIEEDGNVDQADDAPGVSILQKHVASMQRAVTQRSWQVRGPVMVRLQKLGDGTIAQRALDAIEQAQNAGGVGDDGTIGEYLTNVIAEEVADLGLEPAVAKAVTARIVGSPGAPGLHQIKKMVGADAYDGVREFVNQQKTLMQHAIMPIERAVHSFSVELLRGLHSALVGNNEAEVARLRQQVAGAVKALQSSTDAKAMEVLQSQLSKLGDTENVSAAMEGIVFIYRKNAYKFTGSFAPMNQILGMFKYGRGGTKVEQKELQRAVQMLLSSMPV